MAKNEEKRGKMAGKKCTSHKSTRAKKQACAKKAPSGDEAWYIKTVNYFLSLKVVVPV